MSIVGARGKMNGRSLAPAPLNPEYWCSLLSLTGPFELCDLFPFPGKSALAGNGETDYSHFATLPVGPVPSCPNLGVISDSVVSRLAAAFQNVFVGIPFCGHRPSITYRRGGSCDTLGVLVRIKPSHRFSPLAGMDPERQRLRTSGVYLSQSILSAYRLLAQLHS